MEIIHITIHRLGEREWAVYVNGRIIQRCTGANARQDAEILAARYEGVNRAKAPTPASSRGIITQ